MRVAQSGVQIAPNPRGVTEGNGTLRTRCSVMRTIPGS